MSPQPAGAASFLEQARLVTGRFRLTVRATPGKEIFARFIQRLAASANHLCYYLVHCPSNAEVRLFVSCVARILALGNREDLFRRRPEAVRQVLRVLQGSKCARHDSLLIDVRIISPLTAFAKNDGAQLREDLYYRLQRPALAERTKGIPLLAPNHLLRRRRKPELIARSPPIDEAPDVLTDR